MTYPWESIVISIVVLIGAIIVVVLCARWGGFGSWCGLPSRPKQRKPKHNLPRSIQQALTQLEGVTDKRPVRNPQTESEEAECPICLGYLYTKDVHTCASEAGDKIDLEAGMGVSRTTTITTTDVTAQEKKQQSMQPIDDEVLKLKRCTHIFHARCLATWFLRKKYDCPVCRTPYYQVVQEEAEEDYRIPQSLPAVAFW